MRVLHAYNLHRGGGGADNATRATIAVLRRAGVEVREFVRDSAVVAETLAGKVRAFASGLYAPDAVREFRAELDTHRPQLVHVHELYPLISPWVLPECTRRSIPVVMSVYDYRLTCPTHNHYFAGRVCTRCIDETELACVRQNCRGSRAESLAFALRNALARKARLFSDHVSCFITPTPFSAQWLHTQLGVPQSRLRVLPCVIELPAQPVDDAGAGRYFAFAGRFVPEKGADVAVAAARLAGVPLWLAGDTHQSLQGRHNDDQVRYLVTRSRDELHAFYRGARALVMPSVWFETFGIVVGEAMAHGVPVIASRIGALAETTLDGVTGLHVPPGDAQALAFAMRSLWDDPALACRLGRAGRDHIEKQSGAAAHLPALLAIYEEMLARGEPTDFAADDLVAAHRPACPREYS